MAQTSRFVLAAQLQLKGPTRAQVNAIVNRVNKQLKGIQTPDILNGTQAAKNAAKINAGLSQVQKGVNKTQQSAQKLNNTFARLQQRFKQRFLDATVFSAANAAIVTVTAAFQNAFGEAIKFEREMVRVAQVTGKTAAEMAGLQSTITKLATSFGSSSSELAETSVVLSQAGLNARQTEIALKAIQATDLAPTFNNMADTAEGAIAILGQFGGSVNDLTAQLGSINAVAGQFAVSSSDIIDAVKRGGSAFASAGGSLEEFIALFTSVRSTTREGAAQIATGLRTIFTRIQRPQTLEYFRELGVELTDVTGKLVAPFEAVRRLAKAFGDLEKGDTKLIAVAEQLGGTRQVTRVLPLLQQFAKSEDALQVAVNGTNSLFEDRDKVLNTFQNRLKRLTESFREFGRALTGEAGAVGLAIESLTVIIRGTTQAFQQITGVLPKGAAGFAALGVAVGVAGKAFFGLNTQMALVTGGLTALSLALSTIGGEGSGFSQNMQNIATSLTGVTVAVLGAVTALKQLGGLSSLGNIASDGLFQNKFRGSVAANRQARAGGFTPGQGLRLQAGGERALDAAGGAGVGLAAFAATAAIFQRTNKALEEYNKEVESGSMIQAGAAAVQLQANKDLDNAGAALSAGVGAVASVFLGPVAGQLVGAVTGVVTEMLFQTQIMKDLAAFYRDIWSNLTGGIIHSTQRIAEMGETAALANKSSQEFEQSMKDLDKAVKTFTEENKGERLTGKDAADIFSKEFAGELSSLNRLNEKIQKLSQDTADLSAEEKKALEAAKEARSQGEEQLKGGLAFLFKNLSLDGTKDFEEAIKSLDAETRAYLLRYMGYNEAEKIFQEQRAAVEAQLISAIEDAARKRYDAELKLGEATRGRIEKEIEARELIAQYGGAEFTSSQRTGLILGGANAGASASGISSLTTGSPQELRKRSEEIAKELQEVRDNIALFAPDEESGAKKRLEDREKELLRLNEQTYTVTKELIKQKQEELKIIEAKNRREQEGLEAAIAGDFDKLFQAQAAQGATAAISLGDDKLARAFGQTAIAAAFTDLKALQGQGVNSLFGKSIGGQGGLLQSAASAGLAGVGITDPRAAGVLAGTTVEQNALNTEIRDLASTLPLAGQVLQDSAAKQVEAADKQLAAANANAVRAGADLTQVSRFATGGSVFRKRGTDTVPAMLTPGEFVVNAKAVRRGNNLNLLRQMNGGGGGAVNGGTQYLAGGGQVQSGGVLSIDGLSKLTATLDRFSTSFSESVTKLQNLSLQVTIAPTSVNVNLSGGEFIRNLTDGLRQELFVEVGRQIQNYKATEGGSLQETSSNLPSFT